MISYIASITKINLSLRIVLNKIAKTVKKYIKKKQKYNQSPRVCDCVDECCRWLSGYKENEVLLNKFCQSSNFVKQFKMLELSIDHLQYVPKRKVWTDYESVNDADKPVYIKKWSTCDDRLVFKLNAQIDQSSDHKTTTNQEPPVKVLQVVNKDGVEIILKYNTGTADLVKENENITTVKITNKWKSVLFWNQTTLREKITGKC